jgi:DNA-binding transcriptional regulator GbsR (MarR family)
MIQYEQELAELLFETLKLENYREVVKKVSISTIIFDYKYQKESFDPVKEKVFKLYKEYVKENMSEYIDPEIKEMKEHLDEFDKFMVELGKLSPETHPELYAA